jgi:hypothetical protein
MYITTVQHGLYLIFLYCYAQYSTRHSSLKGKLVRRDAYSGPISCHVGYTREVIQKFKFCLRMAN